MTTITYRWYEDEEDAKKAVEARRRRMAQDPAFAKGRATFSVLQSLPEPRLYGFLFDHNMKGFDISLDYLAMTLRMQVFRRNVMPFYGPMGIVEERHAS